MDSRIDDATRWWLDPERVEGSVHGVFEGGGAKGLLYVGALEGVLRRKLWFSAVAGSSAGAITAAMIAAGMRPSEMRAQMKDGLAVMALPRTWNGLRRVRHGTGLLDQDALCDRIVVIALTEGALALVKEARPVTQKVPAIPRNLS